MNRRLLGSATFAAVVALSAAIAFDPATTPTSGVSVASGGVTLNSSVMELVAATGTPCNAGGGRGNANGRCSTPTPSAGPTHSPTPAASATSCPGSCKPLLSDSRSGAVVRASNIKPGDTARGSLAITANGNVYVSLLEGNVAHAGPAGSGNLADHLQLVITDQTAGIQLYSGAFDAMPTSIAVCGGGPPPHQPCQRWKNGESHTFQFVVSFPNAANDSDNTYQQTGASADIIWGATR